LFPNTPRRCLPHSCVEEDCQMKILPLLAKCNDFVHIGHTFNVLPLVHKEDYVSTYEVQYLLCLDGSFFHRFTMWLHGVTPQLNLGQSPPPPTPTPFHNHLFCL
jgi:hypothetical protein